MQPRTATLSSRAARARKRSGILRLETPLFVDDATQVLLPITPYLVLLLLLAAIWAFRNRDTRLGRWRYGVLALVLWSACMSTPAIGNALVGRIEAPYPPVAGVSPTARPLVVVLSTGSIFKDGDHNRVEFEAAGWERLNGGVDLWRRVGGTLLFVGEPSKDGTDSVAAHMGAVARSWGVPADAIQVEVKSRTTYENLLYTRDIVAAHDGDAWLVTSALHMRRAMGVAHKLGLRFRPYPCDRVWRPMPHWYAWLPNAGGPNLFTQALHELVGLAYYRLRGYTG
jgi:uncharacterized SAM-binding protein YcdF (DUF218 family)